MKNHLKNTTLLAIAVFALLFTACNKVSDTNISGNITIAPQLKGYSVTYNAVIDTSKITITLDGETVVNTTQTGDFITSYLLNVEEGEHTISCDATVIYYSGDEQQVVRYHSEVTNIVVEKGTPISQSFDIISQGYSFPSRGVLTIVTQDRNDDIFTETINIDLYKGNEYIKSISSPLIYKKYNDKFKVYDYLYGVNSGSVDFANNYNYRVFLGNTPENVKTYYQSGNFPLGAPPPAITTGDATNIGNNSATLNGSYLLTDYNDDVNGLGFKFNTSEFTPGGGSYDARINDYTQNFQFELTGLYENTTFYYCAYVDSELSGMCYGELKSFTTSGVPGVPAVTTANITNITQSSATAGGNVTSEGCATVTERGVVYSTSENPTTSNGTKVTATGTTGDFTCNLTGLNANTTYYVKAFATNNEGTSYGSQKSFKTNSAPTVQTSNIYYVTETSARGGGTIMSDGGADISEKGIVFSTSQNPTTSSGTKITSNATSAAYPCDMTGLSPATTYYVRAYATNSVVTSYGEQKSFTTNSSASSPTVTTASISNIAETTATAGGNVTSDGGATVIQRGVVYSTSPNPTTSNTKITASGTTGAFTCNLEGLTKGETYYVRAFATNNQGTSYGSQQEFTTLSLPTVITSAVYLFGTDYAIAGGNVTGAGGSSISERGIVYSTSPNPSTGDNKVTASGTTGEFSCELNGLTSNTVYYIKAFATNSEGTAYGQQTSFCTKADSDPSIQIVYPNPGEVYQIPAEGATFEIEIQANVDWTVSLQAVNGTAFPESGSGNAVITISVMPNGGMEMPGAILIEGPDGVAAVLDVLQLGMLKKK